MKNAFVIFLVLIFSGLNLFSQSFKQNIDVQISGENQSTAVFFIENINDSISINKLDSETEIVTEKDIYPLSKDKLTEKLTWNFTWGISSGKTVIYVNFNPFYKNASGEIFKVNSISINVSATRTEKKKLGKGLFLRNCYGNA